MLVIIQFIKRILAQVAARKQALRGTPLVVAHLSRVGDLRPAPGRILVPQMQQIRDFADERNKGWCVYCGGRDETRDHVPSRAFLDEPFPPELPVVPACSACNASFSPDEAYLACLVECALTGSVELARSRPKVDRILTKFPLLAARLAAARHAAGGRVEFTAEVDRVRVVMVKLARGHVAFEQSEPRLDEPSRVSILPITTMSEQERTDFEKGSGNSGPLPSDWNLAAQKRSVLPEVGSRALFRVVEGHDLDEQGWIRVQPRCYRYRVECDRGLRVQLVMREYLMAEVAWD